MSKIVKEAIENLNGFQNLDKSQDWLNHEPNFEWTDDDYAEFEWERKEEEYSIQEQLAMAMWWEMEGVRCATFGRDPNRNPYL